ncbi:MAG: hypothetical protein AB1630_04695 [bacterium]
MVNLSIIYIGFLEPKHNKFFEVVNSYGRVAENGNLQGIGSYVVYNENFSLEKSGVDTRLP